MPERSEFASFLRSRRERVSPEDVGLPAAGRRRTPGLRREELAALAGISVDYVVRLEQGRETNPSPAVLGALSRTLRLTTDEARHLKVLAAEASCGPLCPSAPSDTGIDATTIALLNQLDRSPAFVLNHLTDVLAWNAAYQRLMTSTGLFDQEPPNLLRYTFLDPRSRELYRGWERIAREQVGNLRSTRAQWRDDGSVAALVGELSVESADFARLWAEHDVGETRQGVKALAHPEVGDLTLEFTTLAVPDGLRFVAYLPATLADQATLELLVQSDAQGDPAATLPARLRIVG